VSLIKQEDQLKLSLRRAVITIFDFKNVVTLKWGQRSLKVIDNGAPMTCYRRSNYIVTISIWVSGSTGSPGRWLRRVTGSENVTRFHVWFAGTSTDNEN